MSGSCPIHDSFPLNISFLLHLRCKTDNPSPGDNRDGADADADDADVDDADVDDADADNADGADDADDADGPGLAVNTVRMLTNTCLRSLFTVSVRI